MANILSLLPEIALNVTRAILPLVIFFIIFQFLFLRYTWRYLFLLLRGIAVAYIGLILFFLGVDVAFLPAGQAVGEAFGQLDQKWLLIPLGFLFGFFITLAEPQVKVLGQQVEEASAGYIRSPLIVYTMASAIAVFAAIGMAKTVFGIPIQYIVIPGYIFALCLLVLADKDFVGIAFDSGGVATGPITITFILSMTIGAASVIEGRSPLSDGFGLIGLVTLSPIISIMLISLFFKVKSIRGGNNNAGRQ